MNEKFFLNNQHDFNKIMKTTIVIVGTTINTTDCFTLAKPYLLFFLDYYSIIVKHEKAPYYLK